MKIRTTLMIAPLLMALAVSSGLAQEFDFGSNAGVVTGTTVTNATGTITQLNYGPNGTVEGFLLGTNILLTFPGNVTGGFGTLGAAGNSVTYSGTAFTTSTGFQSVRVSSLTNNTTRATYTAATATAPTSTSYGPVSGTVKQLNYDNSGAVDGFLFTASGSSATVLVVTDAYASATLKPLLTVGGLVSVTGITHTTVTSTVPALTVVEASSLTINGQTIVIARGGGVGRGGPGGHH